MPQIRIANEDLQRLLWPGEHFRVRIIAAEYDFKDCSVVFTVKGENLPEGDVLMPIVSRAESTNFVAVRS